MVTREIELAIDALEIAAGYTALVAGGIGKMPILKERAKSDCEIIGDALEALEALQSQPASTGANERGDEDELQDLRERDEAQSIADDLAHLIERITGRDVGEHSNANCPWENAKEFAEDYISERTEHPPQPSPQSDMVAVPRSLIAALQMWRKWRLPASYRTMSIDTTELALVDELDALLQPYTKGEK